MPKRTGKIEPEELRAEIIFAKKRLDKIIKGLVSGNMSAWSGYLNRLVKEIVPVVEE